MLLTTVPSLLVDVKSSVVPSWTSFSQTSFCFVRRRSLPPSSAWTSGHLGRRGREDRQMAVRAKPGIRNDLAALDDLLDAPTRGRHPGDVLGAIVDNDEIQGRTVLRPVDRIERTVDGFGEDARATARGRNNRQLQLVVRRKLHLVAKEVRDVLPVGAPRQPAVLFSGRRRQAPGLRARFRVDDEHVAIGHLVDVPFAMLLDEGDLRPVRRPRGVVFIELPRGQGLSLLRIDVEQIEGAIARREESR